MPGSPRVCPPQPPQRLCRHLKGPPKISSFLYRHGCARTLVSPLFCFAIYDLQEKSSVSVNDQIKSFCLKMNSYECGLRRSVPQAQCFYTLILRVQERCFFISSGDRTLPMPFTCSSMTSAGVFITPYSMIA